jgi:putative endonuclease
MRSTLHALNTTLLKNSRPQAWEFFCWKPHYCQSKIHLIYCFCRSLERYLKTEYSAIALRQLAEAEQFCYACGMYYVYAIYNKKNDKFYIGQCEDLFVRVSLHNSKEFSRSYTARFDGEWRLIYNEEVPSRSEALVREKQLKSFRGREFIKKHIPR